MRLFPPTLEIKADEGFDSQKDIFGRETIGRGLTNLLSASSDPLVLALNAPWGTGKSTFLKMWAGSLRKAGFPVIYFDAFAHDYLSDGFEALAGEIVDLAKSNLKPPVSKKIKDAAVSAGKVLIKAGAAIGVRAATAGVLSVSDLSGIADDAKDAIGAIGDKIVEDAISNREKQRTTLESFRKTLAELPSQLNQDGKPLIFIIDELDRCKPPFALEVLERIKHFFAVPNVHFVLGVHMKQLENSISASYGSGVDATLYLQKFISLQVNLDVPGEHRHESIPLKYIAHLAREMEFKSDDRETLQYTSEIIEEFSRHRDFKLRTIEKIMSALAVALAYTAKNFMRIPPILAGLVVMKIVSPELYAKAQRGTLTYYEVEKFFDLDIAPKDDGRGSWPSDYFIKWWQYCLKEDADPAIIAQCDRSLFSYNVRSRTGIVRFTANYVLDRFSRAE